MRHHKKFKLYDVVITILLTPLLHRICFVKLVIFRDWARTKGDLHIDKDVKILFILKRTVKLTV